GLRRLGSLIRHIPHAVTVGFTCGIAVTIAASQLKDLAGLKLTGVEPGPLIPKVAALAPALLFSFKSPGPPRSPPSAPAGPPAGRAPPPPRRPPGPPAGSPAPAPP